MWLQVQTQLSEAQMEVDKEKKLRETMETSYHDLQKRLEAPAFANKPNFEDEIIRWFDDWITSCSNDDYGKSILFLFSDTAVIFNMHWSLVSNC